MNSCSYYQARVQKEECWFFAAVLRSYEHLCFDRTYDVENSIFEFFVPYGYEDQFIELMIYFKQKKIVSEVKKLPNRLMIDDQSVGNIAI